MYYRDVIERGQVPARFVWKGVHWESMGRRVVLNGGGIGVVCVTRIATEGIDLESMLALIDPPEHRDLVLGDLAVLSDREFEVGLLIAAGCTDRDIADRLHRSVRTVHAHRRALGAKLSIESRVHVQAIFARRGLLVTMDDLTEA